MSILDGVDVASFQGGPTTWQAEAGPIGWAGVKLTELTRDGYIDPCAAADWHWLQQTGKARVGYLFGHPAVAPTASVAFFIAELARLGLEDHDAVGLDIEVTDGKSPGEVAAWSRAVLASLRTHLGRVPLLYTFPAFAEAGNVDGCGSYPLWISDPNHPAGPAPWRTWAIHQYQTGGPIDRDVIGWPDIDAMQAALGKTAPKPAAPAARKAADMILVEVDRATLPEGTEWPGVFLLASDATLHHVTTDPDVAAYKAAGIPGPEPISYAEYVARSAAQEAP